MTVEVLAPAVIDGGRSRIGVAGGDLDVAEGNPCIECRHDEGGPEHVGMDDAQARPLADGTDPAMRRSPVESLAVVAVQDRTLGSLAESKVDGPGHSGNQGDDGRLVALADDTGGARTALPRQRTLGATVAWSYQLLSEPERHLFDRLSVFAGGFSLDGAVAVCGDESLAAGDVITTIAQLCERSMVTYEEDGGPVGRYGLLETLRQFGRDRLSERGESTEVRDRHLAWAVAFAEAVPPQTGPLPPEEVRHEHDNLRVALEWALERGDEVAALRITGSVWIGHFQEQRRVFEHLLPLSDAVPPELAAKVLFGSMGLAFMMGDWQLGLERASMTAEAARAAGDTHRSSLAVTYQGLCAWGLGHEDEAVEYMQAGIEEARAAGHNDAEARTLCFQAWWWSERDLPRAVATVREARNLAGRGDLETFTVGHIEEVAGFVTCLGHDFGEGARQLADATATFKHIQLSCGAHILETCAAWAAMTDRLELGAELLGAAERIREETADKPRPWERVVRGQWLPRIEARLERADLQRCKSLGRAFDFADALDLAARELRAGAATGTESSRAQGSGGVT
jgi:hypothetical protein